MLVHAVKLQACSKINQLWNKFNYSHKEHLYKIKCHYSAQFSSMLIQFSLINVNAVKFINYEIN